MAIGEQYLQPTRCTAIGNSLQHAQPSPFLMSFGAQEQHWGCSFPLLTLGWCLVQGGAVVGSAGAWGTPEEASEWWLVRGATRMVERWAALWGDGLQQGVGMAPSLPPPHTPLLCPQPLSFQGRGGLGLWSAARGWSAQV